MSRPIPQSLPLLAIGLLINMAFNGVAYAKDPPPRHVQVMVGGMSVDADRVSVSPSSSLEVRGEYPHDLPLFGLAGWFPLRQSGDNNSGLELGIELGAIYSWRSGDVDFVATGTPGLNVLIRVENRYSAFDFFIGAYASKRLGNWGTWYLGAGPVLYVAEISIENNEEVTVQAMQVNIDLDESESAAAIGGYARSGIEFDVGNGGLLGLGVRYLDVQLDFDDSFGKVDIRGPQGFITYSMPYELR